MAAINCPVDYFCSHRVLMLDSEESLSVLINNIYIRARIHTHIQIKKEVEKGTEREQIAA